MRPLPARTMSIVTPPTLRRSAPAMGVRSGSRAEGRALRRAGLGLVTFLPFLGAFFFFMAIPPSSRALRRRVATHRSDDGPPGAREADAGPRLESLADLLDLREELALVDERLAVGVHHDAAVDDHRVHAPAIGVVDEIGDRVPERLPFGPLSVEEHEVRLLPRLDRSELIAQAECLRTDERGHLERGLGRDLSR